MRIAATTKACAETAMAALTAISNMRIMSFPSCDEASPRSPRCAMQHDLEASN
jgi:hypothetical protein